MAQKNPSLTTLKQYLKTCSKEELIGDITELFKKFPVVKDYYQVKLNPQDLKDVFRLRCRGIVDDTSGIGWGFHDALGDLYDDVFEYK